MTNDETRHKQEERLRQGINRAFAEIAEAKRTGRELPNAWDLLKELREDETEREAFLTTAHRNASLMFSEKI